MEKDVILIIGGGGMSGVFSAGVLKVFEESEIAERVHSIYAVSVGACTGGRFLAGQSELGGRTFYTRFNTSQFIRGHFVRYFFQVLRRKRFPDTNVDEILNFEYFTQVLLASDDKIDMEKMEASPIPFYVKVFNKNKMRHEYLLAKGPHAFDSILATTSMTPLTSRPNIIDRQELFDGDTIPSDIEGDIARQNHDKRIIKIDNSSGHFLEDRNLFVLLIIYVLLRAMHGKAVANIYSKNFFKRPFWRRNLKNLPNVLVIENSLRVSAFSKNTELLKRAYNEGVKKGREALMQIGTFQSHHRL